MESTIISQTKNIISGRILIPASTLPSAPAVLLLTPPQPFLVGFSFFFWEILTGATFSDYGVNLTDGRGGVSVYPFSGSNQNDPNAGGVVFADSGNFAPANHPSQIFNSGEINAQLSGAPYLLNVSVFNKSVSPVYFSISARFAPKIKLIDLPIDTKVTVTPLEKKGITE
jgi:hypothetical protein